MSHQQAYCKVAISPVRIKASDSSEMVTQLLFGEVVDVLEQTEKWWKIQSYSDNYTGWVDPKQVRKLTKKEVSRWMDGLSYLQNFDAQLITPWGKQRIYKGSYLPWGLQGDFNIGNDTFVVLSSLTWSNTSHVLAFLDDYENAPYLWGGKTPVGIDCSGFTQALFRFVDINLPRDAYQQFEYGTAVDFSERQAGDVAFFANEAGKIIHVGIILENLEIMHASGQVRTDTLDNKGILHHSGEYYTHDLVGIKRMI